MLLDPLCTALGISDARGIISIPEWEPQHEARRGSVANNKEIGEKCYE
jgi:hypothetical protein